MPMVVFLLFSLLMLQDAKEAYPDVGATGHHDTKLSGNSITMLFSITGVVILTTYLSTVLRSVFARYD